MQKPLWIEVSGGTDLCGEKDEEVRRNGAIMELWRSLDRPSRIYLALHT